MNKINIFSLFLIITLTCNLLSAQTTGRILDAKTKEPLAYVNIGVIGKNMGSISNDDGSFQLPFDQIGPTDTLRFSAIGYAAYDVNSAWLQSKEEKVILLQPITYRLSSIEVKSSKEETNIGIDKKKKGGFGFSGKIGKGTEVGTRISTNGQLYQLKTFHFYSKKSTYDRLVLRLNIYELSDGKVGKNLLQEEVRFELNSERGWINVDLGANEIYIQDDFMVSLEFVKGSSWQSPILLLSKGDRGTERFYRASSFDQWKITPEDNSLSFYFTAFVY